MPEDWFNPFVKFMLRSPLHGVMSSNTILITYRGRKSGRQFTLPIGYLRQGDALTAVSSRSRVWWRNLRGGAPVTLLLQGVQHKATGEVVEDHAAVVEGMAAYIAQAPQLVRYFKIALKDDGTPDEQDLAHEAAQRVLIRIRLLPA